LKEFETIMLNKKTGWERYMSPVFSYIQGLDINKKKKIWNYLRTGGHHQESGGKEKSDMWLIWLKYIVYV
jgi:hypothetical protein